MVPKFMHFNCKLKTFFLNPPRDSVPLALSVTRTLLHQNLMTPLVDDSQNVHLTNVNELLGLFKLSTQSSIFLPDQNLTSLS